jgi:hypothetical protein
MVQCFSVSRGLAVTAALAVVTLGPQARAQQCLSAGNGPACTNPAGNTLSGGALGISDNQNAFNVTNSGTITGTASGIVENTPGRFVITNSGTIFAGNSGILALSAADIVNTGTISAGITASASPSSARSPTSPTPAPSRDRELTARASTSSPARPTSTIQVRSREVRVASASSPRPPTSATPVPSRAAREFLQIPTAPDPLWSIPEQLSARRALRSISAIRTTTHSPSCRARALSAWSISAPRTL